MSLRIYKRTRNPPVSGEIIIGTQLNTGVDPLDSPIGSHMENLTGSLTESLIESPIESMAMLQPTGILAPTKPKRSDPGERALNQNPITIKDKRENVINMRQKTSKVLFKKGKRGLSLL